MVYNITVREVTDMRYIKQNTDSTHEISCFAAQNEQSTLQGLSGHGTDLRSSTRHLVSSTSRSYEIDR